MTPESTFRAAFLREIDERLVRVPWYDWPTANQNLKRWLGIR